MVSTRKFSQFVGDDVTEVVGLTSGANTIGPNEGGGSGDIIATIDQDTSGLTVGRWVRINNAGLYVHALADSAENAEVEGVVREIISATQFTLQQAGYIPSGTPGFNGFSVNNIYFLSDTALGEQTLTEPTENGKISKPVFAADSADSGWVICLQRGLVIGTPGPIPSGGGGGSDSNTRTVSQPGNGFSIGDWVRVSADNVYSLADATSLANAQSVGVVTASGDPNFTIQFAGWNVNAVSTAYDAVGAPIAIASSTVYYLSDVVPGQITPDMPTPISKPVFISESAINGTGWILPQRPLTGSENPNVILVNQVAHGLAAGRWVYLNGATYTYGISTALATSQIAGLITSVIDANNFTLQFSGYFDNPTSFNIGGLAPAVGGVYYLSTSVAGNMQLTEPSVAGQYSKPVFLCNNAAQKSGFILPQRPIVIPSSGGGGGILQVQSNSSRTVQTFFVPINTWTAIPSMSVTITPSSASSRIKLSAQLSVTRSGGGTTLLGVRFRFTRNGSVITDATGSGGSSGVGATTFSPTFNSLGSRTATTSMLYVDSPASAAALTYAIEMYWPNSENFETNITNASTIGTISIIIAEEIG